MLTPRNHHLPGSYCRFTVPTTVLFLLAGCCPTALTTYKSRPFFLIEEDVTTHGRKAWYDSIIELDPGDAELTVAADYQQAPPIEMQQHVDGLQKNPNTLKGIKSALGG